MNSQEIQKRAPIAFFAYNRPENFARSFNALIECRGFEDSPVVIYIDGPKRESDKNKVEAVRKYAESIRCPNVRIVSRESNLGCMNSIYVGISEIFEEYDKLIIVEDDLILSPVALDYFNACLSKYENNAQIWSIVGYQYSSSGLSARTEAMILPYSHTWSWATWKRCWSKHVEGVEIDESDLDSRSFKEAFDGHGVRDFRNILELTVRGQVSSWFTKWYYSMFCERGVSVFPPVTYVKNIGFTKGGTHASFYNPYRFLVFPNEPSNVLCRLPENIKIDYKALDMIRNSWDARVQRYISHVGRIKRKIFNLYKQ